MLRASVFNGLKRCNALTVTRSLHQRYTCNAHLLPIFVFPETERVGSNEMLCERVTSLRRFPISSGLALFSTNRANPENALVSSSFFQQSESVFELKSHRNLCNGQTVTPPLAREEKRREE